jgi:hypothetical protein
MNRPARARFLWASCSITMNSKHLTFFLLPLCVAAFGTPAQTTRPTTRRFALSPNIRNPVQPLARPVEQIQRVLVFSIDGLRPDLLLRSDSPNIHRLMDNGAFSMWATTTPNSITLPSHMSMMTGVNPRRHDVEWNRDFDTVEPLYPRVPTLFEAAKRHGYTTAVVSGKVKFDMFDRPGVLDYRFIADKTTLADPVVCEHATQIIKLYKPQVMLVHFPGTDSAGHNKGWSSPEQMKAINTADACVGRVLAALDDAGVREETLVILSADHGGAGRNHGPDDPRSRHIPWIASGPGLKKGFDLSIYPRLEIRTEDTFATACWALGIRPTVSDLEGNPIKLILDQKDSKEPAELLQPTSATTKPSW